MLLILINFACELLLKQLNEKKNKKNKNKNRKIEFACFDYA